MPIVLAYVEPPAVVAPPPRPSVITLPDWLLKPTAADLAQFYPKAAASAHIEGRAVLHCQVTDTGNLSGCTASGEEPVDQGFGDAALHLSVYFKMRPMTKDGAPVSGAHINIPIRFALPKQGMPSAEVAMRCYGYSAAEAERNPTSQMAQVGVFAYRLMIEMRLASEHPRPSEAEEVLLSQRHIAADKIDDPKFKAERDECVALLGSDPMGVMQRLLSIMS
ncbi:MAG TPA: TonB family protein [Phenylobacterium sp.]|jgi:TonB family protein|nr:TonB family protein [Phenylobacterium sp.]